MQSFKDLTGQTWNFKFTVLLRRTIRTQCGIDIAGLIGQTVLKQISEEPERVVDMIWACIESKAIERGVDFETFFTERIDSDLLESVTDLMFDEAIEYAPKKNKASLLKLLTIYRQTGNRTIDTLMKNIESIDAEEETSKAVEEIENLLATKSTNGSTSLPPSSE